jgi:multisubunit Na+/H+ antiporter MnhG subunit
MTALSTAVAIVMTPLNLSLWGGLNPETAKSSRWWRSTRSDMLLAVFLLLGLPMIVGMWAGHRFPNFVERAHKPVKIFSIGVFGLFVIGALAANWRYFLDYVGFVVFAVFLHNGAGAAPPAISRRSSAGLPERDRRAVSIEVGIQNSALGLILIFNFFDGLGGMAIVTAWWGIWHIVSGLTVSTLYWSRRPRRHDPACVLVTGSSGYLGSQVVAALAAGAASRRVSRSMCARCRRKRLPGVIYVHADIRAAEVDAIVGRHRPRRRGAPGLHRHAGQEEQSRIRVQRRRRRHPQLLEACLPPA